MVFAQRTDRAEVLQVIKTALTRRGDGKSDGNPIRLVTQYWSFDGILLAEVDPFPDGRGAVDDESRWELPRLRKLAATMAKPLLQAALRNHATDDDVVDVGTARISVRVLRELVEPASDRESATD